MARRSVVSTTISGTGSGVRGFIPPNNLGENNVPKQQDKQEIADLERMNAELTTSLDRCRELLSDCRSHLAANSNQWSEPEEGAETSFG